MNHLSEVKKKILNNLEKVIFGEAKANILQAC